jgi:hypothetical protein
LCLAAAPLAAQEANLWLGGTYAHYADSVDGWAGSVGGRLGARSNTLWGNLDGYLSRFTSGPWVVDVQGGFGALGIWSRRLAGGARAQGYSYYVEDGDWSGAGSVAPILVTSLGRWITSAEIGVGGVRRLDGTSDLTLSGALRATRVLGRWSVDFLVGGLSAADTAFADATFSAEYRTRALGIGALVGARAGDLNDDPVWLQGFLEWWMAPPLLLEARAGTYPEDITGFASGFFARLGIRVGMVQPSRPPQPEAAPGPLIEPLADGGARVVFVVPDATTVEIAGEWNAWTPTRLTQLGGSRWEAVLSLGSGAYRFSLILDGDEWIVPEGVPTLPDDFGSESGMLLIP